MIRSRILLRPGFFERTKHVFASHSGVISEEKSTFVERAKSVRADAYDYDLPDSRIALHPLKNRAEAKLLLISGDKNSPQLKDHRFHDLPRLLPRKSLLVRNNSRVIRARVPMLKPTGGRVELLLLAPASGMDIPVSKALSADPDHLYWRCFVGGKRVRVGHILRTADDSLSAQILERDGQSAIVKFLIPDKGRSLLDALSTSGRTPLPPYIRRPDDSSDTVRYQTVYAQHDGSVAAPTAGLHMTREVEQALLDMKGIECADVTLHVGAGTFLPLGGDSAGEHNMHEERASISHDELARIHRYISSGLPIIALGTTSVRTLESMYWYGVLKLQGLDSHSNEVQVGQWTPYEILDQLGGPSKLPSVAEALAVLLDEGSCGSIVMNTKLLIVPGYPFQLVRGLMTNFHQPRSTLLMLVAAFSGGSHNIVDVYKYAKRMDYRFLSYGDSSLYLRA